MKGEIRVKYELDPATGQATLSLKAIPDVDIRNTIQILLSGAQAAVAQLIQEESMLVGQGRNDGDKKKSGD